MSKLDVAVTHLNAPYGPVVAVEHFVAALRAGSYQLDEIPTASGAIIASAFNELTANLMLKCIREAGASLESANHLYLETLAENCPPSPEWEEVVDGLS
ncbi:hypothetical protein [Halomonas heilongjiangensis]|uniref:Uncharacterized protein n=1 Tax=Halomonas heilongjiangensis TaxID=1387883 RepID=A0A2N7TU64_9GAMM|nr:hypothetical protein [Halomonas heilongjiangensis]PMR71730.1 hypothetical protein C1H66_01450 [Halomonas heilongjiangensis]PXX89989.1 hypothetical protein CR158_10430 [Halomonas heilongjiangensis]